MFKYQFMNGKLVASADAKVQTNDLAILRGYGIFDYFAFEDRIPYFVDDYLTRFFNSAAKLHLDLSYSKAAVKQMIMQLIEANGVADGGMKLVLTGGYSENGYEPTTPNFLIIQYPKAAYPEQYFTDGVKFISHRFQRELPEVKTINYLTGIQLLPKIKAAGAVEVLYYDGVYLRETVRANVMLWMPNDTLVTPADQILYGITRKKVLKVARQFVQVEERDVRFEEIKMAKEMFLTSSTRGVMPVIQVDDHTIGTGKPGPMYKELSKRFIIARQAYLDGVKSPNSASK